MNQDKLKKEILEEFDEHLKWGATEYGTSYPPHPELKKWLSHTIDRARDEERDKVKEITEDWFSKAPKYRTKESLIKSLTPKDKE